jgi:hypothetical protein
MSLVLEAAERLAQRGDTKTLLAIVRALVIPRTSEPPLTGRDVELLALENPEEFEAQLRGYWALLGGRPVDAVDAIERAECGEAPPTDVISSMPREAYFNALTAVRQEYARRDALRAQNVRRAAALLTIARSRREAFAA